MNERMNGSAKKPTYSIEDDTRCIFGASKVIDEALGIKVNCERDRQVHRISLTIDGSNYAIFFNVDEEMIGVVVERDLDDGWYQTGRKMYKVVPGSIEERFILKLCAERMAMAVADLWSNQPNGI